MAVHQTHVLRVPRQVLAVEHGVVDIDILALPERVLRHDVGVVQLHVLAVLEHVFRVALQAVDAQVIAKHEGIGAVVQLKVSGLHILTAPESLVSIVDDDIVQMDMMHLAKHLGGIDACVAHQQVVAIPQGGTGTFVKLAMVNRKPVDVPERVLAHEAAVLRLNVRAMLDGRLAVDNRHMIQSQVVRGKQRALAPKFLILNQFHQ